MPDPSRLVPPGSSGKMGFHDQMNIPRPRSPTFAGLLSPAPIKHTPQTGSSGTTTTTTGTGTGSSGGGSGNTNHAYLNLPKSPNTFQQYTGINTPLSLIRGFPDLGGAAAANGISPNPQGTGTYLHSSGGGSGSDATYRLDGAVSPSPFAANAPEGVASMGLTPFTSGAEATTLPQVSPRPITPCYV